MKLQELEQIIRVQQSPVGLGDALAVSAASLWGRPPPQRRSSPNVGPSLTERPFCHPNSFPPEPE